VVVIVVVVLPTSAIVVVARAVVTVIVDALGPSAGHNGVPHVTIGLEADLDR
jgi:hypothetical protein